MERERREEPLFPSSLKEGWDVVRLGRWAGVLVLGTALVVAAWEVIGFYPAEQPLHLRILFF